MKKLLLPLLALTLLASCGNDNKSGKSSWNYTDPYLGGINGVPSYQGSSVSTVINAIPCWASGSGTNSNYAGRQQMQLQLTGYPSIIPSGDVYVGATSYGDVGVLLGQGNNNPVFIAYLCPRSFTGYQGSIISNVRIATQSNCSFKPLTSASLVFPNNTGSADFRMLDYGKVVGMNGTTPIFQKITEVCR